MCPLSVQCEWIRIWPCATSKLWERAHVMSPPASRRLYDRVPGDWTAAMFEQLKHGSGISF